VRAGPEPGSSALNGGFSDQEREAVYRVIHQRRDVRSHFLNTPVPEDVLGRVLNAAHHAPSVGFMQPWDFLLIESPSIRKQVFDHFRCMKDGADVYSGDRQKLYRALKLEGIQEAPLNVCITCDRNRNKGFGLGRQSDRNTDLYSTVCAIQNFWLAARAESLGVGWVSILDLETVKEILQIPKEIDLVAYLCVGYVKSFSNEPDLQTAGWEARTPLHDLLHFDSWNDRDEKRAATICGSSE
jgi:5,6-dimethylbenzimidazole synthase